MLIYSSWFGDLGGGELRMLDHIRRSRIPRSRMAAIVQAPGELQAALSKENVASVLIPWKEGGGWARRQVCWYKGMLEARRFLGRHPDAIVLCNTFHDLDTVGRVARRLRMPVIWRARADTFTHTHRWPATRLSEFVRFLNQDVARIVPTTNYEAQLMMEAGVDRNKIRVIHNGVDLSRFDDRAAGQRLREQLRIDDSVPVISFVARMVPQKGYEVFFEALAGLRAAGYRFKALVAGDTTLLEGGGDAYRAQIASLVDLLGLHDSVLLLGARKDVPAIMNASDVFVLASLKEPFGTTVIEAMAAAKPVVCSDLAGPRESAVEGETAYFFPAGDAHALQAALTRILEAPDAARDMGRRGRLRAEKLFSMDAYITAMDQECTAVMTHVNPAVEAEAC